MMAGFLQTIVEVGPSPVLVLGADSRHWIHLEYVSGHSHGGRFAKFVDRGPGALPVALHNTQSSSLVAHFKTDGSVELVASGPGVFTVAVSLTWV